MNQKQTIALVTGASRGIGRSIVEKMIESGFYVIGTAIHSDFPEKFTASGQFEGIHADLEREKSIMDMIRPVFEREEFPQVVVNNAGISQSAPFELDDEKWLNNWDRTVMTNLKAPAIISKWALNRWKKEGDGILINVSSRASYRGDTGPFASYAASKGGLTAFTKTVAREFGKYGIAAYTIAPGFIDTDMAREGISDYGKEYLTKDNVLEQLTPPSEVGELVSWLAKGKVKHMTGATFHINAGSYMI